MSVATDLNAGLGELVLALELSGMETEERDEQRIPSSQHASYTQTLFAPAGLSVKTS